MNAKVPPGAAGAVEDASVARPLGPIAFFRRVREDQLSILGPDVFHRNIVYNRLLFLHSFLINKPEYIEHVLVANHRNYRKSVFLRRMLGPLLGNGLLISEGEFWRRQRRIAAPAFHNRRIAGFVETMASSTESMLARWRAMSGPFDVAAEMMALTLDIIARTMFSTDVSGDVAAVRRLTGVVMEQHPSLFDLLGLPEWLPRRQPAAYRRAIAAFEAMISRFLAARRADGKDRGDLLAMLLAARDPDTGEGMSDRQLRDEILTVFLAGHETTANALSWTWYLLARHRDAEARLHEEVDRVLGGRTPSFADLAALTWTRMVVEEAMRLYPPAHAVARTAIEEDRIGGVRIPAGASISISMYVTHRNPNLWPDPERFDPERFAPDAVARRHRFAYLPFGGGARICIGSAFAMAEAQVIVAAIAQRYRLRLAPGREVQPVARITLRPKDGVWVTLRPRRARTAV
jgi:cytochrome P450